MSGKWTVISGMGTWHFNGPVDAIRKAKSLKGCDTWITIKDPNGGKLAW